jgi:hypothetical protein
MMSVMALSLVMFFCFVSVFSLALSLVTVFLSSLLWLLWLSAAQWRHLAPSLVAVALMALEAPMEALQALMFDSVAVALVVALV